MLREEVRFAFLPLFCLPSAKTALAAYAEREVGEAYAEKATGGKWICAVLSADGPSAADLRGHCAGRAWGAAAVLVRPRMGVGGATGLCADLHGSAAAAPG